MAVLRIVVEREKFGKVEEDGKEEYSDDGDPDTLDADETFGVQGSADCEIPAYGDIDGQPSA